MLARQPPPYLPDQSQELEGLNGVRVAFAGVLPRAKTFSGAFDCWEYGKSL